MTPSYYDRDGRPMSDTLAWAKRFEETTYKRIAETTLPDGKWISTVWLGLDHSFGRGPPLIFETMVFKDRENLREVDVERYATEAEAREGHERMVTKWSRPGFTGDEIL